MKRNWILNIALLCMVFSFVNELAAANYVRVATIGGRPPLMDPAMSTQAMVEEVIKFWKGRLAQVLPDEPDLIVLPEACDRPAGLTIKQEFEYYGTRKDQLIRFFASIAAENHCYIVFGTKEKDEQGRWKNFSMMVDRKGMLAGVYEKNFPTIGEMDKGIMPGRDAPVFHCDFGSVACAICYDLNFTELCERYAEQKPDIIAFSSMYHGGLMQEYWAYQCRAYFVAALGFRETPSEIRNPLGEVVASSTNYFDFAVTTINLDRQMVHLDNHWGKLTELKKKYGTKVRISDPGKLGPVLISSEHESVSAEAMVKEFDMELIDSYFSRSRAQRDQHL